MTWNWGFKRKLQGKLIAWLSIMLSTSVQQQWAVVRLSLSSQNKFSPFFSSQMEDKLLFQKQKWFVAATHKLTRHLQPATASQRDEATKEGVSIESRNETSRKYQRFPELWATCKIYLTKIHIYLHKYKACYLKMPNHSWQTLGYIGSNNRLLGVRGAFTLKKLINLPYHEQPPTAEREKKYEVLEIIKQTKSIIKS